MKLLIPTEVLRMRQAYSLDEKIQLSIEKIREWHNAHCGRVYVSFSGGLDSTVLRHLVHKVSDHCCEVMKKRPFKLAELQFGYPFIGTRAEEGQQRELTYLQYGCNAYDIRRPRSTPLAFWLDSDIREYIRAFNVPYSEIYDMGYQRTGCMFCMFGVHLSPEPNRFQLMRLTHPKQYEFCMDKLGLARVLDYIKVPYREVLQPRLF